MGRVRIGNIKYRREFFEFAAKHLDITTLSASVSAITLPPKAVSSPSFTISSNKDWEITCPEERLNIDAGPSSGRATVSFSAEANTENSGCSAVISIKTKGREQTVAVYQASSRPELEVVTEEFKNVRSKDLIVGGSADREASFEVRSNTAWSISISYTPQEAGTMPNILIYWRLSGEKVSDATGIMRA